jgi:hypothetical protein
MTRGAARGCHAVAAGPYPLTQPQADRIERARQARAAGLAARSDAVAYRLEVHGRLEVPRLRSALRQVSDRHPALRTVFEPGQQRVVPCSTAGAGMELVTAGDRPDGGEPPVRFAKEQPVRGRVQVVPVGPEHHRLTAYIDHLIADDHSIYLLFRDLWRAYAGEALGDRGGDGDPGGGSAAGGCQCAPHAFRDFAVRQNELSDPTAQLPPGLTAAAAAMRARDSPFGFIDLPVSYPLDEIRSRRSVHGHAAVDHDLWQALARYGDLRRCSPFMLLTAAVAGMLRRRTGTDLPMIYTTLLNRSGRDRDAVGWYAANALLAGPVAAGSTLGDLVGHARSWILEALRGGVAATHHLHQATNGAARRPATLPSLSVAMVDRRAVDLPAPPGLRLRQVPPSGAGSLPRGRIVVLLGVDGEGQRLTVSCEEQRFPDGMVDEWASDVVDLLRAIAQNDSAPVDLD